MFDGESEHPDKGWSGVLVARENDVLAEILRAVARRADVGGLIQEASRRLQRYFGTASLGIWFVQEDDLVLKGLCVPDRFGEDAIRVIREGYESISLDDDLPGPRAMRERRTLRLTAGDPSLDLGVREILRMLDVSLLLAIPVFAEGDAIGCGVVGVPEEVPLTAADESLLRNALDVLAILHHRDQLRRRDAELSRQVFETSHMAAVGDLTATVAHEVNNPLGAIEQFTEALLLDEEVSGEVRDTLQRVRSEAARAGVIVRSLLDFSHGGPDRPQPVDVAEAVERTLHLLGEPFLEGVGVSVEIEPDTPRAWIRAGGLRQVLHNILVHARRSMEHVHDGGEIRLVGRGAGSEVEIVVEDQGPVLPPGYEHGTFVPFLMSGGCRHALGLSLAHRIIREHDGTFSVEAWGEPDHEDPSRGGARFIVTLPSAPADAEAAPGAARPPGRLEGTEILLVEDETPVADATRKLLERLGCRVTVRATAEAALEVLRGGYAPDLVLSDIRMPGIGGEGLHRALREEHPELLPRIVFTSGDIVSPDLHRFLAGAGRPLLRKPYELDELRGVLLETLRGARPEDLPG